LPLIFFLVTLAMTAAATMDTPAGIANSGPWLPILHGSQTGTAQEVAEYLAAKAKRRGYRPWIGAIDAFPLQAFPQAERIVFVVATTGDGEAPDNMKTAWKFLLRKALPKGSLSKLQYAMFGLGDTSYAKYCAAARKLAARLTQLGGTQLVPAGYGDEQCEEGGVWSELDAWSTALWSKLEQLTEGTVAVADDAPVLEPPLYTVQQQQQPEAQQASNAKALELFYGHLAPPDAYRSDAENASKSSRQLRMPHAARVLVNRRLTHAQHKQDVRHIELDVSGMGKAGAYVAGDVAWVHPKNDTAAVTALAQVLQLDLDSTVQIALNQRSSANTAAAATVATPVVDDEQQAVAAVSALDSLLAATALPAEQDLPQCCTVRELLTRYLDITGTPRRAFFEKLSLFAALPAECEKLLELASPAGAELLHVYCTRERRTYVEVLTDFQSCKLSLERLVELVPRLRPRAFSIASASVQHPGAVHLCVAVVSYKTHYKRDKTGVCSGWLAQLQPGDTVQMWIRRGTFTLPADSTTPVIMVGPGTGLAPMRSIIQQRCVQRQQQQQQQQPCDTLFFGCRYAAKDYLYSEELQELVQGQQLALHTAFSRDAPAANGGKVYVQQRIREAGAQLYELIVAQQAHIYVSGSAKQMPEDVRAAFASVLAVHGSMTVAAAEQLLKGLDRAKRYTVEAWS
jgi:sulfite reductase alpha subunit-like flavoprotein